MSRIANQDEQTRGLRIGRRMVADATVWAKSFLPENCSLADSRMNIAGAAAQLILLATLAKSVEGDA